MEATETIPAGTPVVLRHDLISVPTLARGHLATIVGDDPSRDGFFPVRVETWLGLISLDVRDYWLKEISPELGARLHYLCNESDADAELRKLWLPYDKAVRSLTLLIRQITKTPTLDISPLWRCQSAGDVMEAYGISSLGRPTREELTRRWAVVVQAHAPIDDLHASAVAE